MMKSVVEGQMTYKDLKKGMTVGFSLNGDQVEAVVAENGLITLCKDKAGELQSLLIPIDLLDHVKFTRITTPKQSKITKKK
jgi:hypothetical protein